MSMEEWKEYKSEEIAKEVKNNINDEEFGAKFGVKFGVKFGIRFGISDKQILLALHSDPSSTAAEIAQRIGISQRAVEKQMKKFKDLGIIHREGSRKNGLWVINKGKE